MLIDRGIDWAKSREVYDYCKEHGFDTGVQIPVVSELSGNILLGEIIIGNYGNGEIIIYEDDLLEAILVQN